MKYNKSHFWYSNLSTIISLAVGIVFTVKPDILATICQVVGALACIIGVALFAVYFIKKQENGVHAFYGLLFFIGGILLYLAPTVLSFMIPVLFGLWVLMSSGTGMYRNFLFRASHQHWLIGFIMCTIGAILGVYIITRPVAALNATIRTIGITMIIFSVLRLISAFLAKKQYEEADHVFVDTNIEE